jgi:phage terminase small subunit
MPEQTKSIENIRGHLTRAQRAVRKQAEAAGSRDKVTLVMPAAVRDDMKATAYWRNTINRMRGISLLDNMDTDTLGVYCQQMSRRDMLNTVYRQMTALAIAATDPLLQAELTAEAVKLLPKLDAVERLSLSYAEKLGLTPSGRVRLAKKKAEERPVDPNADLFGDGG